MPVVPSFVTAPIVVCVKSLDDTDEVVETEVEIKNEYPPIRGFIDLVMDWDGINVIGEIKTAKQEVWDTKQSEMKASANHTLQILTYMKLKEVDEGFFVYENKNTQELLIMPIQMNEKNKAVIDELFVWLCEVYDNYKEGDLPMRPYTKSSYTCKNCPVKKDWLADFKWGLIVFVTLISIIFLFFHSLVAQR